MDDQDTTGRMNAEVRADGGWQRRWIIRRSRLAQGIVNLILRRRIRCTDRAARGRKSGQLVNAGQRGEHPFQPLLVGYDNDKAGN